MTEQEKKERLIKRLRENFVIFDNDMFSDDEVLRVTKGTLIRASTELGLDFSELS